MNRFSHVLLLVLLTISTAGMALGQTYLIDETFTSLPPSGWTNGAVAPISGSDGYDGDGACLNFDENKTGSAISIVTTAITDPDRVSFWYKCSNSAYTGTFTVKYSTSSTGPWTDWVSIGSASTTYAQSTGEFPGASGTYYFQLERTGSSGNRKDLYIDVFQVTQSIVVSTSTLSGFIYEPSNGPSSEQSFTVNGVNLTADITLTAPTNYEISTSSGSGFGSNITLTQSSGTVNTTTIYVRLKSGLSEGAYNSEIITISSTDKFSKSVTCNGDVRTSIIVSTATLTDFNYDTGNGPSSEQSFTVSGQDLTANISITAPTNYEISTTSGSGFGSNLTLTQSGGAVALTTIYVRLKSGLSQGTYNNETITLSSTGKVSKTVTCSGFVGPLILNIKIYIEGGLW